LSNWNTTTIILFAMQKQRSIIIFTELFIPVSPGKICNFCFFYIESAISCANFILSKYALLSPKT